MNKNNRKPIILVSVVALVAVCSLAFAFVFSQINFENTPLDNNTVVPTVKDEKFVTDIQFEYFYDPADFFNYISDCTDFYFPKGYTGGKLSATDKDNYMVELDETDHIVEYGGVLYYDNLSDEKATIIEEQIAEDDRFVENLGDLKVLIGSVGGDNIYEYKMVYNMDTDEYNTMPDKAGEYSLITIFYEADENYFVVNRFNNKYWNLEPSV